VLAVTRLGYPCNLGGYAGKELRIEDNIDGLCYIRPTSDCNWRQRRDLEYIDAYAQRLVEEAKTGNVSILHSASNFLNGLAAARAARTVGCKSVYEVRGLWHLSQAVKEPGFESTNHFLYSEIMEGAAAREADAVVTISEALKERLVHTCVKPEKITVIPNAVDLKIFKPMSSNVELKKRLGLEGRTVVGFIGFLTDYEGLDLLINAVSGVVNRGANLALLIIGHGYAEKALKKIAYSNPHKDCIRFVGHVLFNDILKYYSIIDIFPFPRDGYDVCRLALPLKVLEPMATAKPVIVSDLPPLLEMVKDGENGFVCKADDM
jgi:glycosyltransferase involved in cell wall biosynthesis